MQLRRLVLRVDTVQVPQLRKPFPPMEVESDLLQEPLARQPQLEEVADELGPCPPQLQRQLRPLFGQMHPDKPALAQDK